MAATLIRGKSSTLILLSTENYIELNELRFKNRKRTETLGIDIGTVVKNYEKHLAQMQNYHSHLKICRNTKTSAY